MLVTHSTVVGLHADIMTGLRWPEGCTAVDLYKTTSAVRSINYFSAADHRQQPVKTYSTTNFFCTKAPVNDNCELKVLFCAAPIGYFSLPVTALPIKHNGYRQS